MAHYQIIAEVHKLQGGNTSIHRRTTRITSKLPPSDEEIHRFFARKGYGLDYVVSVIGIAPEEYERINEHDGA